MSTPVTAADPTVEDVHLAAQPADLPSSMLTFLKRLRDLLRGKVDPADFDTAVKSARGHAGGKAKAARRSAAEPNPTDSLWVGWTLPAEAAANLAIPGGQAPKTLHLTLAYLGKLAELPDDASERALAAMTAASWAGPPAELTVNGVARFEGHDGEPDVIHATVEEEHNELTILRSRLCDALMAVGLNVRTDHEFTPHITLAYIPEDDPSPTLALPNVELMLDAITVTAGGQSTVLPLRGQRLEHDHPLLYGEVADIAAQGKSWRLFNELAAFTEPPLWAPVLPKPGTYTHGEYGKISISPERNQNFIDNFQAEVYQKYIPVDAGHQLELSGALGYLVELRKNDDGSVDGRIDWTPRGDSLIRGDNFRYCSASWFDSWTAPDTGKVHNDVLIGLALTTRPFFKDGSLRPLVASERGFFAGHPEPVQRAEALEFDELQPTTKEVNVADETTTAVTMTEQQTRQFAEMRAEIDTLKVERDAAKQAAETQAEAVKQAGERLQMMERDTRRKRFTDLVAGRGDGNDGQRWFGEIPSHVSLLETLADTCGEDSEQFKAYLTQNRAAAEQLRQSGLFKEIGSDASGSTATALDRVTAAAKTYAEANKVSEAIAIDHVISTDAKLASEYYAEQRPGGR